MNNNLNAHLTWLFIFLGSPDDKTYRDCPIQPGELPPPVMEYGIAEGLIYVKDRSTVHYTDKGKDAYYVYSILKNV